MPKITAASKYAAASRCAAVSDMMAGRLTVALADAKRECALLLAAAARTEAFIDECAAAMTTESFRTDAVVRTASFVRECDLLRRAATMAEGAVGELADANRLAVDADSAFLAELDELREWRRNASGAKPLCAKEHTCKAAPVL